MIKEEKKLQAIEQEYDWRNAIDLMEEAISKTDLSQELSYRILFLLAYFCSDLPHNQQELKQASEKLKKYLQISDRFAHDPEYLVFSGVTIYLAYFYIGYDSPVEAVNRIKKAIQINSDNIFYQWLLNFVEDQDPDKNKSYKNELLKNMLKDENNYMEWLKSKGLVGEYLLGMME